MIRKAILAAALLAGTAIPSAASASVTITSIAGNPGFLTGNVIYTPGGLGGPGGPANQVLYIGRMRLSGVDNTTLSAVSFDSYCIDIFHHIQNGSFDIQAFSLADPVKEAQLATLLGHTATFIDGAATAAQKSDISAAIQMAVWEIVNESGTAGYSLGSGLFQIGATYGTVAPVARGLAQGYLDDLAGWAQPSGYSYKMMTAFDPIANQRQVFLAAAVPEPSAWALMIAGFGAVGGAMRARRKTRTAFA